MMAAKRIVVAGLGVAGALLATRLAGIPGLELIGLERGSAEAGDAGTGVNLGPNAIKALTAFRPDVAARLVAASRPWRRWTIALADDTPLMDLTLRELADNDGIRIGWADLYRLVRQGLCGDIRLGAEVTGCERDGDRLAVIWRDGAGGEHRIDGVDFVIAADGRYSATRQAILGADPPRLTGVAMWRMLVDAGPDCPIDDYAQWFCGPARLLAYRVPGERIYCAGSFPLAVDAPLTDDLKAAAALRRRYLPAQGAPAPGVAFLLAAMAALPGLHWARLQEGSTCFAVEGWPVLILGDAAHPMLPTLGQGATQTVEDACVAGEEIGLALAAGTALAAVPAAVERRRLDRVTFAAELSRAATDTMLAGADPVAGTRWKTEPLFRAALARLYRDTPEPVAGQILPPG